MIDIRIMEHERLTGYFFWVFGQPRRGWVSQKTGVQCPECGQWGHSADICDGEGGE